MADTWQTLKEWPELRLERLSDAGVARTDGGFTDAATQAACLLAVDPVGLGGLCLQILLSARKTWAADGVNLSLGSVSQYWTEQWAAYGAPDFNTEGALA